MARGLNWSKYRHHGKPTEDRKVGLQPLKPKRLKRRRAKARRKRQQKPQPVDGPLLILASASEEEIMSKRSPAGGWTRAQLAEWGVPWPPPQGWKAALIANDARDRGLTY